MRRSHGGWLVALAFLLAGCGAGHGSDDAAPAAAEPASVAVPTVAVATRAPAVSSPVETLTVLVTSADGVDSPGLDAITSVLVARPATDVIVVAADPGAGAPVVRDGRTMTGHPAQVAGGSSVDALAVVLDALPAPPDLVVVGVGEDPAVGSWTRSSETVEVARAAAHRGIPALAVTAGDEHGTDLAAVGLLLFGVFDLGLDALVDSPGTHVLTVPSCASGLVRGPVVVDLGSSAPAGPADCAARPWTTATTPRPTPAASPPWSTSGAERPRQAMP